MRVNIKYEETVERATTHEIDAQEFLEWVNEGYGDRSYDTVAAAVAEEPGLLKEYLEAAATNDWATAGDGYGYDERLLEVTL